MARVIDDSACLTPKKGVQARFYVLIFEKGTPSVQAVGRCAHSIYRHFGRESPMSSAIIMEVILTKIKTVLSEAERLLLKMP